MELPEIMRSKKFTAAALASAIAFAGFRAGMTQEQIAFVVGPLLVFVGAQAVADVGKERARVGQPAKDLAALRSTKVEPLTGALTDPDAAVIQAIKRNPARVRELLDQKPPPTA